MLLSASDISPVNKEPKLEANLSKTDFLMKKSLGSLVIILQTPVSNILSILRNNPWNLSPFLPLCFSSLKIVSKP